MPYRELARQGRAMVVEIEFPFEHRLEVYTGASTVVIFATEASLAMEAVEELSPQKSNADEQDPNYESSQGTQATLTAPVRGATDGELEC